MPLAVNRGAFVPRPIPLDPEGVVHRLARSTGHLRVIANIYIRRSRLVSNAFFGQILGLPDFVSVCRLCLWAVGVVRMPLQPQDVDRCTAG